MICDSQIHAPDLPGEGHVGGMDADSLIAAMQEANVDRCVIVPLVAPGDATAHNMPAVDMARAHPRRFGVMGRLDLTRPESACLLADWKTEYMLGIRLSFVRGPNDGLLIEDRLEWFWAAAEQHGIPVMVLVPNELVPKVGEVAERHPGLRLVVDHLGLTPYVIYDELGPALEPLVEIAKYPNIATKASALPASVPDPFPFASLHEPLHQVFDAFGPHRLFWGSDLTRLACPYSECVRLFTDELEFLTGNDKEWVLGRGIMEWLEWAPPASQD